mgnify:CR=1 FL=1|tara:strand:- start:1663 stop:2178 length:516 start_codon:yes stop_codon:yes gene_type:complete
MKKYKFLLALFPLFLSSQNYDPETGEIIEENFDPITGKKIVSRLDFLDENFDENYNQYTILQEHLPLISTPRYRLGKSVFSLSELKRELSSYPESDVLLKKYHNMRGISYVGCAISIPMIFFGDDAPLAGIASFYGGLFFTIYAQNKADNILREAIWVYNRENLKKNLLLD